MNEGRYYQAIIPRRFGKTKYLIAHAKALYAKGHEVCYMGTCKRTFDSFKERCPFVLTKAEAEASGRMTCYLIDDINHHDGIIEIRNDTCKMILATTSIMEDFSNKVRFI